MTERNRNFIPDSDDEDIVFLCEYSSQTSAMSTAQEPKSKQPQTISLNHTYTQEEESVIHCDSEDEQIIFHTQPTVLAPPKVHDEYEDDEDEDDDEDIISLIFENQAILDQIDGKYNHIKETPQKCVTSTISSSSTSDHQNSDDDDLFLIEVADKFEKERSFHKSQDQEEVQKPVKAPSPVPEQFSTETPTINLQEPDFRPKSIMKTVNNVKYVQKPPANLTVNEEDAKTSKKRLRISESDDSHDTIEFTSPPVQSPEPVKNQKDIEDLQKLQNFVQKTKIQALGTPKTKLIDSPRLTKTPKQDDEVQKKKFRFNRSPSPVSPMPEKPKPKIVSAESLPQPVVKRSTITSSPLEISNSTGTHKKPSAVNETDRKPKLTVDAVKKRLIEKTKLDARNRQSSVAIPQTKKVSKTGEFLKTFKSKETTFFRQNSTIGKPKAVNQPNSSISLTQGVRIAKMELTTRNMLLSMNKTDSTSTTAVSTIDTNDAEDRSARKPDQVNWNENKTPKPLKTISNNTKPGVKKTSDFARPVTTQKRIEANRDPRLKPKDTTTATMSKPQEAQPIGGGDDIVSRIIAENKLTSESMRSTASRPATNHESNSKTLFDFFIYRILKWNYNWLMEQDKHNEPPPVTDKNEVNPVVWSYLDYDEYHRIMCPLLLLETWEEITRLYRESCNNPNQNNQKTVYLKSVTKLSEHLIEFQCQMICLTDYTSLFDDDLIKMTIDVFNPTNKQKESLNLFGYVRKSLKLRSNQDKFTIPPIDECLKRIEDEKKRRQASVYDISILVRYRKYSTTSNMMLNVQTIGSLASSLRRVKALIKLRETPYHMKLLSPNEFDPIFRCEPNRNKPKTNERQNDSNLNDAQKLIVSEASSIVDYARQEPKFYFIQGPPGTGKSSTIVNIIEKICKKKITLTETEKPLKILVCSPSNGGCDELARRIKHEVDKNKIFLQNKDFGLVRIGRSENIHRDCSNINLENLITLKQKSILNCLDSASESVQRQFELLNRMEENFRTKLDLARRESNKDVAKECEEKLQDITRSKRQYEAIIRKKAQGGGSADRNLTNRRVSNEVKDKILKEANIVICTLNFSGNKYLDSLIDNVSVVIIDEAAQCLEVDCLIPLRFNCNKFILVGDPEQLPATVLSKEAQDNMLAQSLFERLYTKFKFDDATNPIRMLHIQYRMHSDICLFPSKQFYRGKLKTDSKTAQNRSQFELKSYLVFDLIHSQETGNAENGTLLNEIEANFVFELCKYLNKKYTKKTIGVITPYARQVQYIKELFSRMHSLNDIDVGTVDGFQGREKDIVLLCCVRAQNDTIGFLSNVQRLNVSLTRAKYAMYIVCNRNSFRKDPNWNECMVNAHERQSIFSVTQTNLNDAYMNGIYSFITKS